MSMISICRVIVIDWGGAFIEAWVFIAAFTVVIMLVYLCLKILSGPVGLLKIVTS